MMHVLFFFKFYISKLPMISICVCFIIIHNIVIKKNNLSANKMNLLRSAIDLLYIYKISVFLMLIFSVMSMP